MRFVGGNPIEPQRRPQPFDTMSTCVPPTLPVIIGQVFELPGHGRPPPLHTGTIWLAGKVDSWGGKAGMHFG